MRSIYALLLLSMVSCKGFTKDKAASPAVPVAVVELFTSEGCSSCPPADRLMFDLDAKYGSKIIILSYHVDYWDRLGWKDRFSSAENSSRQRWYGSLFKLNGVYTPQAVVNGSSQYVGSNNKAISSTIDVAKPLASIIKLDAERVGGKLKIHYQAGTKEKSKFTIALVIDHAETDVLKGENRGRKINHLNVVNQFKSSDKNEDDVEFDISKIDYKNLSVALLGADAQTGKINTAAIIKVE